MSEKERIIQENYLKLEASAIEVCKFYKLSFRKWLRIYGLYCSGKEINADTRELGESLLDATVITLSNIEKELVERAHTSIRAELVLDNTSSLKLTPKRK